MLDLLWKLRVVDEAEVVSWILECQHESGRLVDFRVVCLCTVQSLGVENPCSSSGNRTGMSQSIFLGVCLSHFYTSIAYLSQRFISLAKGFY